ncbi:biotin carboxylase N-terminal domain-containing protein [uncultured Pseudomonas sp.]|uniref:acetyl-CoA carboxylase biotin carboxylase subunit n=1 Tax=uncultured Pseudomonas sp. TaxID=114707 RepID=UPI00261A6292|nr:biotin carboxylase N-terminal domain-containing protein [uncultured Pseudomonas sp.]
MTSIKRVLIANRGEIAVRIIRTCKRLGIETVLAASEADLQSLAARLADKVVCIGPARSAESYLNVDKVVAAAIKVEADALHPGYGFLSENKRLAAACAEAGVLFIGPTVEQLDAVGDKLKARANALAAGLPVVPGGEVNCLADAQVLIGQVGCPALIKAVGGGGGRGMKRVYEVEKLEETIELAIAEAQAAFGDPRVYLERFVTSGRHVEVQVLGDGEQVIHLGTRDCSVQRRYQKLVEEAPAPLLSDELRESMHQAAVAFAKYLKYRGLGTVELLVDCERETFYFLEMNARIQVEHPVTEAICGLDLVAEQIAVAEGRPLGISQEQVHFSGHAIECRINAEDWSRDFQPCPGSVKRVVFPAGAGIRVDTHLQRSSKVPPFYDSLVAKLIVHGNSREDALQRLRSALAVCRIEGITTNLPMHAALMEDAGFSIGGVDTAYFTQFLELATKEVTHG